MSRVQPDAAHFLLLYRFFWLVWLLFLSLIWMVFSSLGQYAAAAYPQLPDLDLACLSALPQYADYSVLGKATVIGNLILQFAVYAALLAVAHWNIYKCSRGEVFVGQTLKTLGFVGWIVLVWPLFDLALTNLTNYAMFVAGDADSFEFGNVFDVGPFGVGLLILSIRLVIEHAISMKQDQDLTI
jgi:Protein of unknown function (DUF2975)